jgi:hypothetical protein
METSGAVARMRGGNRGRRALVPHEYVIDAVNICQGRFAYDREKTRDILQSIAWNRGLARDREWDCDTLAVALGQEWDAAVEAVQSEQDRQERVRIIHDNFDRLQQWASVPDTTPGTTGPSTPSQTVPATAAAVFAQWGALPYEVRLVAIERLADVSPAAVVALDRTDREAHEMVGRLRHRIRLVGGDGTLEWGEAPLRSYALAAAALGQSDPFDLLLMSMLCELEALANLQVQASLEGEWGQFDLAREDYDERGNIRLPVSWAGLPSFSSAINGDVLAYALAFGREDAAAILASVAGDAGDAGWVPSLKGPLGGSLPERVREWYDWTTAPIDDLIDPDGWPRTALAARFRVRLYWDPYKESAGDVQRTAIEDIYNLVNAVRVAARPDVTVEYDDWAYGARLLGYYPVRPVREALGDAVTNEEFAAWLESEDDDQQARIPVADAAERSGMDLVRAVVSLVGERVDASRPPGACSAVRERRLLLAPFGPLFGPESQFWLVPLGDRIAIVAILRSAAIEQALDMAASPTYSAALPSAS